MRAAVQPHKLDRHEYTPCFLVIDGQFTDEITRFHGGEVDQQVADGTDDHAITIDHAPAARIRFASSNPESIQLRQRHEPPGIARFQSAIGTTKYSIAMSSLGSGQSPAVGAEQSHFVTAGQRCMIVGWDALELGLGKARQPDLVVTAIGASMSNGQQHVASWRMQRDVEVARYVVIVEQQFVYDSDLRIVHESTDGPFADRKPFAAQLGRIAGAVAEIHEAAAGKSRTMVAAICDRFERS